jgi:hypothetical protein
MTANYVLLEKITVGAAGASSVTFSSIPQTGYTDLVIKTSTRESGVNTADSIYMRFNGSSSSYTNIQLRGNGSSTASYSGTDSLGGLTQGTTYTANTFASTDIYIPNYTSSNFKSISVDTVTENNGTQSYAEMQAVLWSNTAAITSIAFTNGSSLNWAPNTTFYLYGVAKLGTTPAIFPQATGGSIIETDGTYWYHAFLSSGTFTPVKGLSCDVLVVAGGGGGTIGGGGAGGLLSFTSQSLIAQNYTITVGAGGVASTNDVNSGSVGNNSSFQGLTAAVGGGSGGLNDNNTSPASLLNGGSGGGSGGAGGGFAPNGTGTSGQGNNGGNFGGVTTSAFPGGGGGGAGAVGGNATNNQTAGNGGIGATSSLINAMAAVTGTGQLSGGNYYFAGGGGGGGNGITNFGTGGLGGGANASNVPVTNAIANMGGGGGGYNGGLNKGSNGGSGIVIVRYPI